MGVEQREEEPVVKVGEGILGGKGTLETVWLRCKSEMEAVTPGTHSKIPLPKVPKDKYAGADTEIETANGETSLGMIKIGEQGQQTVETVCLVYKRY